MKIANASLILFLIAASGCNPRKATLPPDMTLALQKHYNESNAAAVAELFTDDGAIMAEFGGVIAGKAAIKTFMDVELDRKLQYWVTSEKREAFGNFGYEYGSIRVRDTANNRDLENSKYLTLFRKEKGEWKIHRTIYNTSAPANCASVQITPLDKNAKY